jgi:hypothetical protein
LDIKEKIMHRRGTLTLGILLILVGGFFLTMQFVPEINTWWQHFADWPFWIIGPGLLFIVAALLSGEYGLVVPGTIISGVGALLYYQNYTGDWQSWSYAWTLVIGFVGVGVFIMHVLQGNLRKALDEGFIAIVTSLVMFLIFGSIMRFILGQEPFFGDYWPALLILWGIWLIIRPLVKSQKLDTKGDEQEAVAVEPEQVTDEEPAVDEDLPPSI